jgi:lipopolysaccharide transport system ATP-binding protein
MDRPRAFQELFLQAASFRRASPSRSKQVFWALQDVDLDVKAGEAVGFVGPNGAGKSTLLKLASSILFPTSGKVYVRGRVAALLELGAGFHPDLTGRENIFLNSSIMGMGRAEVLRKLDAIVAFSELEGFIDLPVKHYSSGMYVRLAFSTLIHINPDLLLVDEVLAVGDAAFQKKCLDRIERLQQSGCTIVLVSHNLDSVRNACQRAVWLDQGRVKADGRTEDVVKQYIWHVYQKAAQLPTEQQDQRWGTRRVEIEKVCLLNGDGQQLQAFASGEPFAVEIHFRAASPVERPVFGLAIHRNDGLHITGPNTRFGGLEIPRAEGRGIVRYHVPALALLEGTYLVSTSCHDQQDTEMYDYHDQLYPFYVLPVARERYGMVTLNGEWSWAPQP